MLPSALSGSDSFARCKLGVLGSAGAAICLATCRFTHEWNVGQAINAVTGTRLWLLSFLFLERFWCFFICVVRRLPQLSFRCCCVAARTLLRLPIGDAITPPAFSPSQRSPASFR